MNRATIIYNPLAGPADLVNIMDRIAKQWRGRGWQVSILPTEARGHATALAQEAAAAGQRLVLAAGGDGTLGEVANGLAHSETVMGILPIGTANAFARELNLPVPGPVTPHRLMEASETLANGRVQRVDLGFRHPPADGSDEGRYWLLWTGVGADAFLVDELEPRPKWTKRLGRTSYIIQGVPVVSRFSHITAEVTVDGQSFADDYVLVLVSNCRRYAGGIVTMSADAEMDDGLLEVWLFPGRGMPSMVTHMLNVWRGDHLDAGGCRLVKGRCITITSESSTPVQTDGDPTGRTPVTLEVQPTALQLLVPPGAPKGLFRLPPVPLKL